jgi:hypothetical protein
LEHVSNTITFSQEATNFNFPAGNTVTIEQTVTGQLIANVTVTSELELVQTPEYDGVIYESVSNVLDQLQQFVSYSKALTTKTASNTITFTQDADYARLAENTITFTQLAVGTIGGIEEDADNSIVFTQDVSLGGTIINISLTSTIEFDQDVNADHIGDSVAATTIFFKQEVNSVVLTGGSATICGEGYTKQPVYLSAPYPGILQTVVLPAPLWGDTENIASEMRLMRSMNGVTRTYVKTNRNRRLTYTFRLLEREKAIELLNFLKSYDSDKMRIINWKGEVWSVNLLTNPSDFVQTRRYGTDISLEFEGVKLYG